MLNSVYFMNKNTVHARNNDLKSVIKNVVLVENNCLPSLCNMAERTPMILNARDDLIR